MAAAALPAGVISPGAIGDDVNCGVRLLAAEFDADEALPNLVLFQSTRLGMKGRVAGRAKPSPARPCPNSLVVSALGELADELDCSCPSGTGRGGRLRLSDAELDAVLVEGARWFPGLGLAWGTSSPGSSRSW